MHLIFIRVMQKNYYRYVCRDWMLTECIRVKEINLMPGSNSSFQGNNQLYSGEYLMNVGLEVFTTQQLNSRIVEITAE